MSTDTNSGADVYPVKIRWHNNSEASSKLLTRQWEPTRDSPIRHTSYELDELDTIADCVWWREITNVVIENQREAELVLGYLRRFNSHTNHPAYGHMWATWQTHDAVQRRIEKLESVVGADEGHTTLRR